MRAADDVLARARWSLHRTGPSDAWSSTLEEGIAARVPGTVSGALRDALGEGPVDELLRAGDTEAVWEYRTRLTTAGGPHRFASTGVATVARLLVAGRVVHSSDSAFLPWDVVVDLPAGSCEIVLRLLPLASVTVPRKPRARWLSPLVPDRSMRWRRTPLVGAVDWPGARPVVGPWGGLSAHPVRRAQDRPATSSPAGAADASCGVVDTVAGDAGAPVSGGAAPCSVRTRVTEAGDGVVTVRCSVGDVAQGNAVAHVHLEAARLGAGDTGAVSTGRTVSAADADASGAVEVELTVPRPALWWPHGMGEQALYRVRVLAEGTEHTAAVGFRTVTAEARNANHRGLALQINHVPLFVRGAVWTGADPYEAAPGGERARTVLSRLRDAGATLVRVPGTGCYETEDFHRACDELGLMVWQDVALGPLDPPDDPEWRAALRRETHALAARLGAHPSTVVISGGTEVVQAPVLAGRPAEQWAPDVVLHDVPAAVGRARADVVVVPSSPCSDAQLDAAREAQRTAAAAGSCAAPELEAPGPAEPPRPPAVSPVDASDGVSHYFGVGAYGRPVEDGVTRGVRFAAEALAFAVPPEPAVVRAQFGVEAPLDSEDSAASWRRGLARDPGAAWTFEDTAVTYVHRLFLDRDSDPDAGLARPARSAPLDVLQDHARLLEHERAALAHVFQRAFAQWRSASSVTRGAVVLSAMSTAPGAGWGVLDVTGRPTAAWYGMRRACAPVALSFVPAGGDGLPLHVFNDAPQPLRATVRLTVATVHGGCQAPVELPVEVPAHGELTLRADLADGTFRDLDHAYGFGDREYDAVSASLVDGSGRVLARDAHLSGGPRRDAAGDPGLSAQWQRADDGSWGVEVTATALARFVALDLPVTGGPGAPGPVAEDGYLHLLPGETVHLPVSGEVTPEVLRATRVRSLGAEPVAVRGS